jgi:hypothetical protein
MTCMELREWLIAAGTLSAAGVAAYVGVIRDWWQRPSLSLRFDRESMNDALVAGWMATHPDGSAQLDTKGIRITGRSAYVRIRARNEPRKRTAEEVEVLVEAVRLSPPKKGSVNHSRDSESLGDLPLAVSNSTPTRVTLNIPPGVERHFDLVHVKRPFRGEKRDGVGVRLDVYPRPADARDVIHAEWFEVDLVVAARNAAAQRFTARVDYDGVWPNSEDEIWNHLRVDLRPR